MEKLENIETAKSLFDYMKKNIKYGFVSSRDNKVYNKKYFDRYYEYQEKLFREALFREALFTLERKVGLCYDQIEVIKLWLNIKNIPYKTFYTTYKNHGIIVYFDKETNTYNYFERTIPLHNGIYTATSEEEIFKLYIKLAENMEKKNIEIEFYRYEELDFNIDYYDFFKKIRSTSDVIKVRK